MNKISVIVPVYRVEQYLERCVDSILGQTYTDLEVILVDDGSDDSCPEICERYAQKDNRVRVIHRENGGLSAARNTGLAAATGDIISLVDSDDYIDSNMYSSLMEALIKNDADIAMCDYAYVSDKEEPLEKEAADKVEVDIIDGVKAQYLMYDSYRGRVTYTVAWNKLYKKELFEGVTYPEGRIHEDEARTHELLYKAKKIAYVKVPYYFYFQRDDSIVGSEISEKNLQIVDAYTDRLTFYRNNGENELWKKEVLHSMHMVCYLNRLFEDADKAININSKEQIRNLKKEIRNFTKIDNISLSNVAEIELFTNLYFVYYGCYKKKSGSKDS